MAEGKEGEERALVETWLQDQQQWQRTFLTYLDSMVKNDNFLVHLGNAMRGSLLAGKPYPAAAAAGSPEPAADPRIDQILFALHDIQGQLNDLGMTLEEMRRLEASQPPRRAGERKAEP